MEPAGVPRKTVFAEKLPRTLLIGLTSSLGYAIVAVRSRVRGRAVLAVFDGPLQVPASERVDAASVSLARFYSESECRLDKM